MESATMDGDVKTLELDKICRVCLTIKKDMRPLYGEMIAEMLMECARIQLDNTDGWPDKICIQCVHQVSRCHAFKKRVESSDKELRQYIKGITVIVEEPFAQMEIHHAQPHQVIKTEGRHQEIHIARTDLHNDIGHNHVQNVTIQQQPAQQTQQIVTTHQAQPIVITNGQLHNAQIINAAGQIVATTPIQSTIAAGQICQLVETTNGHAVQMIQSNGQPGQVLQIQRTSDDRCEIIVQPSDIQTDTTTHYYTEDDEIFEMTTQAIQQEEEIEHEEEVEQQTQSNQIQSTTVCLDEATIIEQEEELEEEYEEEELEQEQELEQDQEIGQDEAVFTLELSEGSDCEDKEYLAEFISAQTSCPYPGLFVCNLCRKEFKHSKWLQSHMKSHSNWIKANCKKQPQCEICFRSFKGPGMLKMHMKTHEKTPGKTPTCKICNKEFKSRTILYRHRQTHMEKIIQCGACHKLFSTVSQVQSHQAKLKHDKIFRCAPCQITYTNINDLKAHLQTHVNSKPKEKD